MRYLAIITAALSLAACETVSSDGTVTRWDAKGTTEAIGTAFDTWQRYDRQSRVVGYLPDGTPIYRQ